LILQFIKTLFLIVQVRKKLTVSLQCKGFFV
jgi:hypothetical protein